MEIVENYCINQEQYNRLKESKKYIISNCTNEMLSILFRVKKIKSKKKSKSKKVNQRRNLKLLKLGFRATILTSQYYQFISQPLPKVCNEETNN